MNSLRALCNVKNVLLVVAIGLVSATILFDTENSLAAQKFRLLSRDDIKDEMTRLLEDKGATAAWKFLKDIYLVNGRLQDSNIDPHTLAHMVGAAFYKEAKLGGLSMCDDAFTGGCFHGVIEQMVTEEGIKNSERIGNVCSTLVDAVSCAHGAGHGLNEASGGDLAEALRSCDTFPENIASDCAEGVIMDNSWSWSDVNIEKDPWAVCRSVSTRYQVACASGVGNYFSEHKDGRRFTYTPSVTGTVCEAAPTAEMVSKCFLRLGQHIARTASGNLETMNSLCKQLSEAQKQNCLKNSIRFALSAKYIDPRFSKEDLCRRYFNNPLASCPL